MKQYSLSLLVYNKTSSSINTQNRSKLKCIHGILTPRVSPYVARSILPVFSCTGVQVALLTITTMCDSERGGAAKPIIGSSWNNGVKNHLGLYQVQKCPSMIMLSVFRWQWHLQTPLRPCFKHFSIFFLRTHTHTHRHIHTHTDMRWPWRSRLMHKALIPNIRWT